MILLSEGGSPFLPIYIYLWVSANKVGVGHCCRNCWGESGLLQLSGFAKTLGPNQARRTVVCFGG
jgi:hypothetical protein